MEVISVHDVSIKGKFVCEYCHKPFSKESAFIDHKCKQMQRYEIIKTPAGQLAWNCYKYWLKLQKRQINDLELFLQTGNFTNFCKFAEYAITTKLEWEKFISFMVKKGYTPVMWLREDVISQFVQMISQKSYKEILLEQIDLLYDLAEKFNVEISDLPDELTMDEIHELVKRKMLSILFILYSPKFVKKVKEEATSIHLETFDNIVQEEGWTEKLKQPGVITNIKQCLKSVNLM